MFKRFATGFAALALLVSPALADDGWGGSSEYNQHFNPKTVQTVQGKVIKLSDNVAPLKGMQPGFVATIQTEAGQAVEVQVGPKWFTNFYHQDWNSKVGDSVKVTGSLVNIKGRQVLMVTQGQNGNHKMAIRSRDGQPVWDVKIANF